MANNFKLTGDYYVSIDGSDSNSGLTKDLPKRTIQAALGLVSAGSKTIIVGAGVYQETLVFTSQNSLTISGDGLVILNGNNRLGISIKATINNIIIRNYPNISITSPATFGGPVTYTGINSSTYPILIIGSSTAFGNGTLTTNCIFINSNINASGSLQTMQNDKCIFVNCYLSNTVVSTSALFTNNYIDGTTVINENSSIPAAGFNYNNIQGSIIINAATSVTTGTYQDIYGRYYDLSQAGTNPSGNGSLAQPYYRAETSGKAFSYTNHRILYSTMNANSISTDPLFNNILTQDFTLQASSPMIGTASDGISNIGGTKYAGRHTAKGTTFNSGAISVTNLAFQGNDYIVSGAASGEVVSAPLFHSSTTKIIQKISYNGLLEFNKALGAGPVNGNRNVPDELVYTAGTQGANPDRLVYYLRYSTQTTQPASDPEWDNGGNWTAGNYEVFEWNTKPSIDSATKGNGQPDFNSADTPVYLNATWVQLKVKLRNDYV